MKSNMGGMDRIIRIVFFLATLILFFTNVVTGTMAYILIGVGAVLLITSVINFCPLYRIVGINTCKVKDQ